MFDLNPNPALEQSNQRFTSWVDSGFPKKPQNRDDHHRRRFNGSGSGGVQFRLETMEEDSGVCSPPLWRSTSPPDSPVGFRQARYLSPTSRAQAIARGQRELMEMVKDMPESSYELSLKDIVDQRAAMDADVNSSTVDESNSVEEGEERSILGVTKNESQRWKKNKKGSIRTQESSNRKAKIMIRNGSFDQNRGFLINMVFPFSFGSKKKKKISSSLSINSRDSSSSNHGSKVSPKPELLDKPASKYGGGDQMEWWRRRFSASSDSESGCGGFTGSSCSGSTTGRSGSSGSSGSSAGGSVRSNSTRKDVGCVSGCWPSFLSKRRNSSE